MANEMDATVMVKRPLNARFVVTEGPKAGVTFPIGKGKNVIGRDPETQIHLDDKMSSRRHAQVFWVGGKMVLEDLESSNGTLVNGNPITEPYSLNEGDIVAIGDTVMIYQSGEEESVPAMSASAATVSSPPAEKSAPAESAPAVPHKRVIGAPIRPRENRGLLKGDSQFVADVSLPNMVHMAILRSEQAHAEISSLDISRAEKMPGVIKVFTAADLGDHVRPLPCVWVPGGVQSFFPSHPMGVPGGSIVMAKDRVRYVGDPVAAVVAETRDQAYDALDAIQVTYRPLPVVIDAKAAYQEGAPQLHPEIPRNLNAYIPYGNKEAAEKAIAQGEVVVTQEMIVPRTINNPIEPRGAVGDYDAATGDYTLYASSQSPYNHRLLLSLMVLGVPYNKIRIVSPTIGGSFGTKGYLYPDMALVLYFSKVLGRPVKWVDTRSGLMRSTVQGRDHKMTVTLAGTREGKITGLYCTSYANLGAYPSTIGPGVATAMVGRCISSVYDIENVFCEVYAVFTNRVPLGAQRGSGRTEATFAVERIIDIFSREIGMDRAEVRRKNLIRPEQMPFDNRVGWVYDSGDYPTALAKAVKNSDYHNLAQRKAEALKRGKRLGLGIASFVAISGVGPSQRMSKEGMLGGTWEAACVRVHPTGDVTLFIGSKPHGQHHETTFAQIVADELGVPMDKIEVMHSDTRRAPFGQGSYGSRSYSVGGAAVLKASQAVKAKALKMASHALKTPEAEITFENGKFFPTGNPTQAMTLQEVSLGLWYAWDIPADTEPTLEHTTFFDPPDFNYPYGCHIAEVEVDERTGQVELTRYVAVSDVGVMGNPLVVEGQIHGAIAFGAGEALWEEARYDDNGQLLTKTFTDYPVPRATHLPNFEIEMMVTPNPHTDLGAKGAGEVGTVGAASAISNAVVDALADLGVRHLDMPMTPEKVWRAIRDHQAQTGAN